MEDLNQYLSELWGRIETDTTFVKNEAYRLKNHCIRVRDIQGAVQFSILSSQAYWHLMDYRRGLKTIQNALKLHKSQTELDSLGQIYHIHALHLWGQGKYLSAKQFWLNALEHALLMGETPLELEALIGIGNVWRITGNLDEAKRAHAHVASAAQLDGLQAIEGKSLILLAWDLKLLNAYNYMLPILDRAETVLSGVFNPTWTAEIHDFRGIALLGMGNLEQAEQACLRAYKIASDHNQTWMMTHCNISSALIAAAKADYAGSLSWLDKAEQTARQFDKGELLSQICEQQTSVAEKSGDYKLALLSYKKFRRYTEAILKEKSIISARDKTATSPKQLDQRALKILGGRETTLLQQRLTDILLASESRPKVVGVMEWGQYLEKARSDASGVQFHIISVTHSNPSFLSKATSLLINLLSKDDVICEIQPQRYCVLTSRTDNAALRLKDDIGAVLSSFPWDGAMSSMSLPSVELQLLTKAQSAVSTEKSGGISLLS
ncbi:hypothetical protein NF212_22940 [Parasalinivibrio latis]|uniref:hypothetical protein n=1 Tax=Parasalinivibrio latis TaxID=2952610 RepID=UPI0030E4EE7C